MLKTARICIIASTVLILTGCLQEDLDLQIRFNENPGLSADDPVVFEGNRIGFVRKVSYTQTGDYLIFITVESEFKNAATVDSEFHIVPDPKIPEKMNLRVEQATPGGNVLEDGAVVQGADRRSFLDRFIGDISTNLQAKLDKLKKEFNKESEQIESGVESTLNNISIHLEKLNRQISDLPNRETVKALAAMLSQLRNELIASEKAIRTKIQTELIPQIEQEIDHLKRRLAPLDRDEDIEILETELEKIKKI